MPRIQTITPCLWFDNQAEEAVHLYVSVFRNSKIGRTTRYGKAGQDTHGQKPGTVMSMSFELDGQGFTAINGGPIFKFTEAVSFQVNCDTQDEVDYYWDKLTEGGDPKAQQCGWLKDRFGVSWQVVPTDLSEMIANADPVKAGKAMKAMLQMKKIDIDTLRRAVSS